MSRNNTGNPLGSKAFLDFEDNVKNLDEAVNSEEAQWLDRFGRPRLPLMEQERQFVASQDSRDDQFQSSQDSREYQFQISQDSREDLFQSAQSSREAVFSDFLQASGYQFVGDYAPGIEITEYNQLIRSDGEFWRLSASENLPYTTTGAGMPEGGAFVAVGDAALRQDLANPDMGAAMVARGVVAVDSIADLLALPEGQRKEGLRYLVKGYYAGSNVGGGEFYWDAESVLPDNGGTVIRPAAVAPHEPGRWVAAELPPNRGAPFLANLQTVSTSLPSVLGEIGGRFYGYSGTTIYVSDDLQDWAPYCATPPGGISWRLLPTDDGEVIAPAVYPARTVYRSVGFSTDPGAIQWVEVLDFDNTPDIVGHIHPWSISGRGDKFIVTHYPAVPWPGAGMQRVAWISLDGGHTWEVKYDGKALHGANSEGHAHGVCYDPWADTFYFIEGHSDPRNVYYSYDDGDTWHVIAQTVRGGNSPTTIDATEQAIVLAGDSNEQRGLLRIIRPADRTNHQSMRVEQFYEIQDPELVDDTGLIGFGLTTFRDVRGYVYIGFAAQRDRPFILATDGISASLLFLESDSVPVPGGQPGVHSLAVNAEGQIYFRVLGAGGLAVKAYRGRVLFGQDQSRAVERGRVWGGDAGFLPGQNTSVAVGPGSKARSRSSLAVGQNAEAGIDIEQLGPIAIGEGAVASADRSVAIGYHASAQRPSNIVLGAEASDDNKQQVILIGRQAALVGTNNGIAVGEQAKTAAFSIVIGHAIDAGANSFSVIIGAAASMLASQAGGVVIGHEAASAYNGVAVGKEAKATGGESVVIGHDAVVGGNSVGIGAGVKIAATNATAIGRNAEVNHQNSVVIGADTETQRSDSVCFGDRDVEISGNGRGVYLRSPNGSVWRVTVSDAGQLAVTAV